MVFMTENYSVAKSALELVGMLVVFLLILVAAYYTTKWIGKNEAGFKTNGNLKIIETCRISSNMAIQIVKAGNRYLLIGVSKEQITFLTELSEEELSVTEVHPEFMTDFHSILDKVTGRDNKKTETGKDRPNKTQKKDKNG